MIINWTNENATHYLGLSCTWNWSIEYVIRIIVPGVRHTFTMDTERRVCIKDTTRYQFEIDVGRRLFHKDIKRRIFEKDTERRIFIP